MAMATCSSMSNGLEGDGRTRELGEGRSECYGDLMGFYSDLMGFYGDLMGFYGDLMGY